VKILNFGSMNIDYVYEVDNFVSAGETKLSQNLKVFSGGKGLNQSLALAKAGASPYHAGIIGQEGVFLKEELEGEGVNTEFIKCEASQNGHAIIQVNWEGNNCILLYGGTNQAFTKEYIDRVLESFGQGDFVLLQNEINLVDYIIERAHQKGMKIVLNPSPINEALKKYPLEKIDFFILNEVEGKALTGEDNADFIVEKLQKLYPKAAIVLTLGEKGSIYKYKDITIVQPIYNVKVVDTTAAGDTFTGYFIAGVCAGLSIEECLKRASIASGLSVSRHGAAASVPYKKEVDEILINQQLSC
jgi:ribokinase